MNGNGSPSPEALQQQQLPQVNDKWANNASCSQHMRAKIKYAQTLCSQI